MVSVENSEATQAGQPCSPATLQSDEVARLAKRLFPTATGIARALLPIYCLHANPDTAKQSAKEVHALAAALSALLDDLALEIVSRDGPQSKDMWSKEHDQKLKHSLEGCYDILLKMADAIRIADEQDYPDLFHFDDECEAQVAINDCFDLVNKTRTIVRHTCLARFENLNTEEVQEALRLTWALRKPSFDAVWARKDELFASRQVRAILTPKQLVATPSTNLPGIGALSSIQDLALDDHRKPIWAYGDWPPAGIHSGHSTHASTPPGDLFASTPRQEEVPSHSRESAVKHNTKPEKAPGTVTFGEPSVIKPHPSGKLPFGKGASSNAFTNWIAPDHYAFKPVNEFNSPAHLEAYVIQPLVVTTDLVSTLSHKLESLCLSEEALKVEVQSLSSDYSVMNALLDLQPQLLNLIQSRAAQRQGNVVAVKHGKPIDLSTSMGLFQVKPTVFIISTTTMLPRDSNLNPMAAQLTHPSESVFNPVAGQSKFGSPAPASGFGSSKHSTDDPHLSSPEAYSRYLQEKGELCTYVERNEAQCLQHYQTITADERWHNRNRSLEEIRLADYKAGRQGTNRAKAVSFPRDSASTYGTLGADGSHQSALQANGRHIETGRFPATTSSSNSGLAFGCVSSKGERSTIAPSNSSGHAHKVLEDYKLAQGSSSNSGSFDPPPKDRPSRTLDSAACLSDGLRASSWKPSEWRPVNTLDDRETVPINNNVFSSDSLKSSSGDPLHSNTAARTANETTTDSEGFCKHQHQHGPFCRVQHLPKQGFLPLCASSTEPPSASAKVTPAVDSTPKLRFFGGDVATNTSVSPFGTLTPTSGNSLFGSTAINQSKINPPPNPTSPLHSPEPPANSSNAPFGGAATNIPPSNFTNTLPLPPPAAGQVSFLAPPSHAAPGSAPFSAGVTDFSTAPSQLGPDALLYYEQKLRELEDAVETARRGATQEMGERGGVGGEVTGEEVEGSGNGGRNGK